MLDLHKWTTLKSKFLADIVSISREFQDMDFQISGSAEPNIGCHSAEAAAPTQTPPLKSTRVMGSSAPNSVLSLLSLRNFFPTPAQNQGDSFIAMLLVDQLDLKNR
jgi:hypothetical protein